MNYIYYFKNILKYIIMEKTIICTYWKNNTCKYMNEPYRCCFAHGVKEIKKIVCKYGSNCHNPKCNFDHGDLSTTLDMVFDIPIIDKRKNKKQNTKKIMNKKNNKSKLIENIQISNANSFELPLINTENSDNVNIIRIFNKEKGINDNINILYTDYNKILSIIDKFYIEKYNGIVYEKNKYISKIVNNNYKEISYLRSINNKKDLIINEINSENNKLKNIIDNLKNENNSLKNNYTTKYMVDTKIKKKDKDEKNKIITLYNKYY